MDEEIFSFGPSRPVYKLLKKEKKQKISEDNIFSGGGGMGDIYSEEGDPDSLRLFPEVFTKPSS